KDFGLEHIINKHGDEFEDIAKELDEIIKKGEVVKRKGRNAAYNIEFNGYKVGINQGFNQKGENKWIVTAFNDSIEVGEKTAKTAPANDFTKETPLSLNSKESITQPLFKSKEAREFLEQLSPSAMPKQISIDEFLSTLENFKNKENFLRHIEKDPKRKHYLNLIEPTLKEPDISFKKLEDGVEKEKFIKKFSDGKDFFYLLATKDNKETILNSFKTDKINTILKEFNADIIPTFIRQGSKGKAAGTTAESITQPLFKSKEAREFLELVEGFDKLYKNDALIAKSLTHATSQKLGTSIATSAEGAIKQKVVKGAFDPIFRLLPDGILFGLFSKQIQGGALRYHLKKALSRSLNYDDFKLKLERELKRTHFNSNTSRLINEFMQNLDKFNAEKEAKLTKIREEEELKRLEEQARLNKIKAEQEQLYQVQEENNLKDILEAEESPLTKGSEDILPKETQKERLETFGLKSMQEAYTPKFSKEVNEALKNENKKEIRAELKEALKGLKNKDLEHKSGIIARLSSVGIEKMLSDKAIQKSVNNGFSEAQHFEAVRDIERLFKNSDFVRSENPKNASKDIKAVHRYINTNDLKEQNASVLMTLKESFQNGNRIYSLELEGLTRPDNLSRSPELKGTEAFHQAAVGATNSTPLFEKPSESIAQKGLNLHEKIYLKDNDTPLNVEYKIVNKDDVKPSFTLSKTQFRSEKQEALIAKIKENFNPDLLVNIRGDLKKGNPIITQNGDVISGNHRAAALKELKGENLSKYQNAVKEAFGVELNENEMLVRVASEASEAEIRRFAAASNEGLENNLGEQGVSLFAKYQDKIKALKEAKSSFVADDVYNLKYLVNKALGESSLTKENDTSKALFASLARGRNNTILKALNELEKENLEQVSKVANMFFDNAGAFYNLTHDLDLPKMQNLQNYFSDVLVSTAKSDFTRAEDFTKLNEDIRAFLDSSDKEAMLKLSPNLVSDLLTKAMGAGFARFARLENPSANLFDFLKGLKADFIEKGMPDLFSGGKGVELNERDEFDFTKELILKGQDSEAKFKLYGNLEELKAWRNENKTKLDEAKSELSKIDETKLSDEQKELLKLFKGEIKSVKIQVKDLKDIYTLKQGSRKEGAKKILIKHYGEEKTGGLNNEELLNLKEVIKKGEINLNSLEIKGDILRYGYDYEKDGVKLRVVVDDYKDGKKIFDYYSDRNFNHYEQGGYKPDLPTPSESIAQKAKNDEVLEAEVIEQASLNEPVKIRYFKQEAKEVKRQGAKQKTINKVDEYAKSEEFKALSKDKQEAILSLKDIEPSIMPENIKIQDLQHLQKHFKGKLDEKQREKFLLLFNDTKENANLVLEVLKNGELRQEYIKAYQHKESKDLYYIAISKDERDITGIPTTQIQKIINDIAKSERVISAENFGEISNTAAPSPKQTSPQRSSESIAQNADFGENFSGFKGKEAINKLLEEKRGQVKNAFYKEGLGEIDLVWGNESFGLKHILEQRTKQWGEEKALKFISHLSENIEKGQIVELEKGRIGIKTELTTIILDKKDGNNFVITAFRDSGNKKELESLNLIQSKTFTSENAGTNAKESPVTSLNQEDIITQNSEKLPFEMQVFTEDKLSGDEVRHLANKIGEKSTMSYFKDYLLKMDRDFHARAKDIIREYYKIEPFRKELENQWENVKEAYKNGEMSLKEFKFLSKYKDEKSFLNQVAGVLWHHNNELVKNRGYTINKYGGVEQGKGDNYYQNLALEYDGALKNLKKWFYYIQKANKQAQRFFNKNEPQDLKAKESIARRRTDLPSSQSEAEKTTSANANEIIPQRSINLAMEKFHYDEKKAKDLLEWHKDSHALTKDENGLPKVFYHGSGARFEVFKKEFDEGKTGFWFADRKKIAEDYAKDKGGKGIYPAFLKMKNPVWLTYAKEGDKWVFDWLDDEGKTLLKEAKNQGLSIDYFQKDFKFKEFLQSKGYDGIVLKTKINGILQHSVFDSNQIKHIDNKGSYTDTSGKISKNKPKNSEAEHRYFNEKSPNIYH
ncbi:hypothetical protein, partial [Campylobacter vulpis]|uniref:ADP-ribosyltransferase-containing protein n=1 Tax=Campylobacter vulpis TaxID=1655500 RepID=UPI001BD0B571